MKDRDMYYGYGGFYPFSPQIGNNGLSNGNIDNYNFNYFNDFKNRIDKLERQVKRLDQRISRLETPYANVTNNIYNNEPDDNMYMM